MKILFLCEGNAETHDSWSGVSRSVVTHLRDAGHSVLTGDVDLYGLPRFQVAARTMAGSMKRWWVRYHLGAPGFRARSRRAAELIAQAPSDLDVVLQVGATFGLPRYLRIPVALYCDSNIELSRSGSATGCSEASLLTDTELTAVRQREAGVYASAGVIFTMSDMLRQSFIRDFHLHPDRLVTVHCAPNVPFPDLLSETVDDAPPTVLFVGRDFGRKGGALLLEAFSQVRRRVPSARVRFVGCADSAPEGSPPWAEFFGFQSRDTAEGRKAMHGLYRSASVFCLPTKFEPFGTSFVEAMGYGLPCVGPDAWAVPEIIADGETGYLVPPDDVPALANALGRLLENHEMVARMGRAGRARALELFTWPRIAMRMSEVLSSLPHGKMVPKTAFPSKDTS